MFKHFRILLLPFSILYGLIIFIRNKLYDWGIFKSVEFDIPIICVGNLAVGGSGKTPTTEYLVQLLSNYKVAILSRGYGRNTKGFILADQQATAQTIGDEPLQYFQKFSSVTVAVCEDRAFGIEQLKNAHDVIILDDAFQHRKVKAGFNILLFEFSKISSLQFLLPAGNLRDLFWSRKRANLLMVTKSPIEISPVQQKSATDCLKPYPHQLIVHSYIRYGNLNKIKDEENLALSTLKDKKVYLITGIANPEPLLIELRKYTSNLQHYPFPDHYEFKWNDLERLKKDFELDPKKEKIIITTEKDSKRLLNSEFVHLLDKLPIYYLPIQVDFCDLDKQIFDSLILKYVSNNTRNR